jgi:CarD family transcriptional regulator
MRLDKIPPVCNGGNCRDLLAVIRSIRAKGAEAARKGRKLGMVDERVLKQAEEKVCGELAVCLELSVEEVKAMLTDRLKAAEA